MPNRFENFDTADHHSFQQLLQSGTPAVTTIIPAYNCESTICETLQSAFDQDYPQHDIFVVNDGSSDSTAELVEKFATEHPAKTIRLLEKQNGGTSDAKNFGIQQSQSRIIHTLDSDDLVTPDYISTAVKRMGETNSNLFCSNVEIFGDQQGEWVPNDYKPGLVRYDNCITMSQVFDKRLWEQAKGFNVAFAFVEDWDFWVKCSRFGLKVVREPKKMIRYRSQRGGLHSTFIEEHRRECQALIATANEELYSVTEMIEMHQVIQNSPQKMVEKIQHLHEQHPQAWELHFWLGLLAEKNGDFQKALAHHTHVVELTDDCDWQPYYRISSIFERDGHQDAMLQVMVKMIMLRPDTGYLVGHTIEMLREALKMAPAE